jgi:acyl-coenzyme A thioesterase 13
MSAVPSGFEIFEIPSAFIHLIGPLYRRIENNAEILGLRVEDRHCNYLQIAHGGLLATFADIVVSRAASVAKGGPPPHAVTVSLNVDFIGAAPSGCWLEGRASVGKVGKSLGFASCEVRNGDDLVLRASGVMKYVFPQGK